MKPLLFLDVDGVLNCLQATVPCDEHRVDFRTGRGTSGRQPLTSTRLQIVDPKPAPDDDPGGIPVWVPHGTDRRVAQLAQRFEVIWCTAWFLDAHPAFAPILSLPDEPWETLHWGSMKLPAIFDRADGRPWAFVDDDIDFELRELGIDAADITGDHLLVTPDPRVGITDHHVQQLLQFAGRVTTRRQPRR